jgi:hypothetical protein
MTWKSRAAPLWLPSRCYSKPLPIGLCIYHGEKLIATHTRSYDRHQDFEDPEHGKASRNWASLASNRVSISSWVNRFRALPESKLWTKPGGTAFWRLFVSIARRSLFWQIEH